MTSRFIQSGESQLSVLNIWGVSTLCYKRWRESIKHREYLLKFEINFEKAFRCQVRGMGGVHSWKKSETKISLNMPFKCVDNRSLKLISGEKWLRWTMQPVLKVKFLGLSISKNVNEVQHVLRKCVMWHDAPVTQKMTPVGQRVSVKLNYNPLLRKCLYFFARWMCLQARYFY